LNSLWLFNTISNNISATPCCLVLMIEKIGVTTYSPQGIDIVTSTLRRCMEYTSLKAELDKLSGVKYQLHS